MRIGTPNNKDILRVDFPPFPKHHCALMLGKRQMNTLATYLFLLKERNFLPREAAAASVLYITLYKNFLHLITELQKFYIL